MPHVLSRMATLYYGGTFAMSHHSLFARVASFAIALTAASAFAITPVYVSPSGNDIEGDGSSGNPVATIQKGISLCDVGGTVNIGSGTYSEAVTVTGTITLSGAGSNADPVSNTIISGSGQANGVTLSPGTSASNRMIARNLRVTGFSGSGVVVGSYTTLENIASVANTNYAFNFSTLTDLIMTHCRGNGSGVGVKIASTASANKLRIAYCEFNDNGQGWYSDKGNGSAAAIDDVEIIASTFNNNQNKGIYTEKLSNALIAGCTFNNSGTTGTLNHRAGMDVNLKYGAYANIRIRDCVFNGCGTGDPNGVGFKISARSSGSYAANPATLDNVEISGCAIFNCGGTAPYAAGIRISEANNVLVGPETGPTNVSITHCSFVGNAPYALRNAKSTGSIDAMNNWWDSATPDLATITQGSMNNTPYWTTDHMAVYADAASGSDSNEGVSSGAAKQTVQAAVSDTFPGGTVILAAGTYTGQLVSSSSVTLSGAGAAQTIIQAPATMVTRPGYLGTVNRPVVYFTSPDPKYPNITATLSGLTIDGMGLGNTNSRIIGVHFYGANGSVDDCVVTRVRDNPLSGNQYGVAIFANHERGILAAMNVDISNTTVTDYQKAGIVFGELGTTGEITDSSVIGAGPTAVTAQNGIQIGYGASANITGNTISGNYYSPATYSAAGILVIGNSTGANPAQPGTVIENNFITGDQTGIYFSLDYWYGYTAPLGSATGNSIVGSDWPIYNENSAETMPATFNYYGTSDLDVIDYALEGCGVSYSPAFGTDTDVDPSTPGFQGDFSNLLVSAASASLGSAYPLQECIDLVDAGGTITVAAGTYYFDPGLYGIDIPKEVHLVGPKAGIPGSDPSRGTGEAVILPPVNDLTYSSLLYAHHDGVTVDGFTFDGDNPLVFGGYALNGADCNVSYGPYFDRANNTAFVNNIVRNVQTLGFTGSGAYPIAAISYANNLVANNLVDNVGTNPGIYATLNWYGEIANNKVTRCMNSGIVADQFNTSGGPGSIHDNVIDSDKRGIFINQQWVGASKWTISNNTVTRTAAGAPNNTGIHISAIDTNEGVDLIGNNVSGFAYGYRFFSINSGTNPVVTGGTVSNCNVGAALMVLPPEPWGAARSVATVNGVAINNCPIGIDVNDNDPAAGPVAALTLQNNSSIVGATQKAVLVQGAQASASVLNNSASFHDNLIGIDVAGGNATITGNAIYNNGTGVQVRDSGSATINTNMMYANPVQFAFDTASATAVTVNGLAIGSRLAADLESIALANTLTGKTYVTVGAPGGLLRQETSGANEYVKLRNAIQPSITVAIASDTVKAMAGLYEEQVLIDKALTVRGASFATSKRGYVVPAPPYDYETDSETVIRDNTGGRDTVIITANDSIFEGFVVCALNRTSTFYGGTYQEEGTLVKAGNYVPTGHNLNNVVVRNNVLGPNTNLASQDGTKGRMGIQFGGAGGSSGMDLTNSIIEGNKVWGANGNGNGLFPGGAYYGALRSFAGSVIRQNEITANHRSGIEIAGGLAGLLIEDNDITSNGGQNVTDASKLKYGNGIAIIPGGSDLSVTTHSACRNLTIRRNNISGNEKNAVYIGPACDGALFEQNFIANNGALGGSYLAWDGIRVDITDEYYAGNANRYNIGNGALQNIVGLNNTITGNGSKAASVLGSPSNGFLLSMAADWYGVASEAGVQALLTANVDFTPWLNAGGDTDGAPGFQGDLSYLNVSAASPQSGSLGRVAEGVSLLADGALTGGARTVFVCNGVYTELNALVDRAATILGQSRASAVVNPPLSATNPVGILVQSDDVTIRDLTVSGLTAKMFQSAIERSATTLYNRTVLDNVAIALAGGLPHAAVEFNQPNVSSRSTGNAVRNSSFTNCGYAGLMLMAGETVVDNNTFNGMSYTGLYVQPVGARQALVTATRNDFANAGEGVRVLVADPASSIGTVGNGNTFHLGASGQPTLGVDVEWGPCPVVGNTFIADGSNAGGLGNVGVYMWKTATPSLISTNTFTGAGASSLAAAIAVVGQRTGPMAGPDPNDAGQTNATIAKNTITGFASGVALGYADTAARVVNALIGGPDSSFCNSISACGAAVVVSGAFANATISNNSTSFHDSLIGVDVDGGTANVTGNAIYNNGTGVQVRSAGHATVNTNTMYGNPVQFAFDSASATVVNGLAMSSRATADLEIITAANTLTGKVFVAEGAPPISLVRREASAPYQWIRVRNRIVPSVAIATAGDTIRCPGDADSSHVTYPELISVNKALTFLGEAGDMAVAGPDTNAPVVDGQNAVNNVFSIISNASDVAIRGFSIRNVASGGTNATGAGVWVSSSDSDRVTVADCDFQACANGAIFGWVNSSRTLDDWSIVYNTMNLPITGVNGAIDLTNMNRAAINHNTVVGGYCNMILAGDSSAASVGAGTVVSENSFSGGRAGYWNIALASFNERPLSGVVIKTNVMTAPTSGTAIYLTPQPIPDTDPPQYSTYPISDIVIGGTGPGEGNTISGSAFRRAVYASGAYGPLSNVTILGNAVTMTNPGTTANAFEINMLLGTSTVEANSVSIAGLPVDNCNAVSIRGGITGEVRITRNTFNGASVAGPSAAGMSLRSTLGAGTTVTLTENIISGFSSAVSAEALTNNPTVLVSGNNLSGNTSAVTNAGAPVLNASGNWYGTATDAGVQALVTANVDFTPWLNVADDTNGAPGFQGDFSLLNVSAASPQSGTKGRVGEGVSLIADGALVGAARTLAVRSGNYPENNTTTNSLLVDKPVKILGPNAGKAGDDVSRVTEAVIMPAVVLNASGQREWSENPVVHVTAPGVILDGVKVSGDNPSLAGYSYAGMNVCAGLGILSEANDVQIINNVVEKLTYIAVHSAGAQVSPHYTGVVMTRNLVQNVHDLNQLGYGFGLYCQGTAAEISQNKIVNVRSAMQIQPYDVVGSPVIVSGNTISAWRQGIYYNYAENGASAWTITGNQISACTPPAPGPSATVVWEGIRAETMRASSNGGLITANIVDGSAALTDPAHAWGGFASAVWGLRYSGDASLSPNVSFTSNNVSNVQFAFVHDAPVNITLTGNTLSATEAVVRLQRYYGSTGVPSASGGTGNVDATGGNTYNGIASSGATLSQLYAIEDVITHKLDTVSLGFVRVKPANVYVTAASGSIQRGVTAASAADTVNVDAGTFAEGVDIDKPLTVVATSGASVTTINGTGSARAETLGKACAVNIAMPPGSGAVTLDGFAIRDTSSGGLGVLVNGRGELLGLAGPQGPGSTFQIENCVFSGIALDGAAIVTEQINLASGCSGIITGNEIFNSGAGIRVSNSKNVSVVLNNIHDLNNYGVIVSRNKGVNAVPPAMDRQVVCENITVTSNTISNLFSIPSVTDAFGVLLGTDGSPAAKGDAPYGQGNTVTANSIVNGDAGGIYVDSQVDASVTTNVLNQTGAGGYAAITITDSTDAVVTECSVSQSTGTAVLVRGGNALVSENIVQNNLAAGVQVDADAIASVIHNRIENNVTGLLVTAGGAVTSATMNTINNNSGAGIEFSSGTLVAQVNWIQSNTTGVLVNSGIDLTGLNVHLNRNHLDKNTGAGAINESSPGSLDAIGNWWGSVKGPYAPTNLAGQGTTISARVLFDPFYLKGELLRDRDGEGIIDADEDWDLDNTKDEVETDRAVADTDGDGYEDGVEIRFGSNALSPLSYPDQIWMRSDSKLDTDNDHYYDFYEYEMYTAYGVGGTSSKPRLGDANGDGIANNVDVSSLLNHSLFKVPVPFPDNSDINRDGLINNLDVIKALNFSLFKVNLP